MYDPPRYCSVPLPEAPYLPGRGPRPPHPDGEAAFVPPEHWRESEAYLLGVDLFNHGFYWEAHEAWEGLWHAAGRKGEIADFLKALIRLAAAGVKAREGRPDGAARHACAALALFRSLPRERFLGLRLADLLRHCEEAGRAPQAVLPVHIVFPHALLPE